MAEATHCAMGTVMAHRAYGSHAEAALAAIRGDIERTEGLLSRFLPDSDISRVNRSAGARRAKVSPETYSVLSRAVAFSPRLAGCFDVTISPLINLWGIGSACFVRPEESRVRQALRLVNYRDLMLDPCEGTAGLRNLGQSLDLGGIGKGYAADRMREVFEEFGIRSAYSNLGGNVVTVGAMPDGRAWQIGIQHPRQPDGLLGSVSVVNQSVVTSGDYQRVSTDGQGRRHHHILDPRTGRPADSGLISVTVVSDESLAADVLSTAVLVAGLEQGLGFLRGLPRTGAVLVDRALRVYVTEALSRRFHAASGIPVTVLGEITGGGAG